MSYASDRMYARLVFTLTLIMFPIALIIFAFSGCNLRKRSEKRACKDGQVEQCLYVGKYYEDKGMGLIPFLMSYNDEAIAYYTRACKLKSGVGCERMLHLLDHGADQAKNLSTPLTEIADALIGSCVDQVPGACTQLETFMDGREWVENRSVIAFKSRCDAGNAEACYRLGAMSAHNLGGQHNYLDDVLALYEKACAGKVENACDLAKAYRDEKAKREAAGSAGSGAGSGGSAAGSAQ